jgi:hypothetical protein
MSYAVITNSEGGEVAVSNSILNAAGSSFLAADSVNDSDGNPFVIFGSTIETNPADGTGASVSFVLNMDRVFIL